MRNLSRFCLILLVGFFAFLALSPLAVQAYSAFPVEDISDQATYLGVHPSQQSLELSNGHYLYGYPYFDGSNKLYLRLREFFTSPTVFSGQVSIPLFPSARFSYTAVSVSFNMYQVNSTHVLINAISGAFNSPFHGIDSSWHVVNINSFAYSQLDHDTLWITASGFSNPEYCYMTNIFLYNSKYYTVALTMFRNVDGPESRFQILELNLATKAQAVTSISIGSDILGGWTFGYQNPYDSQKVLVMTAYNNPDIPKYYLANLSAKTMTFLATHPDTDIYAGSLNRNLFYMGAEVEYNASYYWVSFNWLYPYVDSGYGKLGITQEMLVFNTTISAVDLLYNKASTAIIETFDSVATQSWAAGYVYGSNHNFAVYYADQMGTATVQSKALYHIEDYWDPTGRTIVQDSIEQNYDDPDSLPFYDRRNIPSRDFLSGWMTLEDVDDTDVYIYYDLIATEADYDITLTYTPTDNPLVIGRLYTFTGTGLKNDAGWPHYQAWYLDNLLIYGYKSSSLGILQVSSKINPPTAGIHNITISLYSLDGSTYLYSESFFYSYQAGGIGPSDVPGVTIRNWVSIIAYGLPTLFCIFIPMIAIAKIKGIPPIIGLTVGLAIGLIIATMGGIIQPYLLFFGLLAIGVLIVFMARNGGNS